MPYPSHSYLVKAKGLDKMGKIWKTKWRFFWPRRLHWVLVFSYCRKKKKKQMFTGVILLYIWYTYKYMVDYIQKVIEMFCHTIKCKYISLNFGVELPIWEGNKHVFSCSVLNPVLIWICSNSMGSKPLVSQKLVFLFLHSA